MEKEDIRLLLNSNGAQHYIITNTISKYVLEMPQKAEIANYIVLEAKKHKNITPLELFKFFFIKTRHLVTGTNMCRSLYAEQMMLKGVWEVSRFQALVVNLLRTNTLLDAPVQEEIKPVKGPETPEQRAERLAMQAAKMRAGKAKKRSAAVKQVRPIPQQQAQQPQQQKYSKEQLEHIAMLRGL